MQNQKPYKDYGRTLLTSKWMELVFWATIDGNNYFAKVVYWSSKGIPVICNFYPVSKLRVDSLIKSTGSEYKKNWELGKQPKGTLEEMLSGEEKSAQSSQEDNNKVNETQSEVAHTETSQKAIKKINLNEEQIDKTTIEGGGTEPEYLGNDVNIEENFSIWQKQKAFENQIQLEIDDIKNGKRDESFLIRSVFDEYENLLGISIKDKFKYRVISQAQSITPQSFNRVKGWIKRINRSLEYSGKIRTKSINENLDKIQNNEFKLQEAKKLNKDKLLKEVKRLGIAKLKIPGGEKSFYTGRTIVNFANNKQRLFTLKDPQTGKFVDVSLTKLQTKEINDAIKKAVINSKSRFIAENRGTLILDGKNYKWNFKKIPGWKGSLTKGIEKKAGKEAALAFAQAVPYVDVAIDIVALTTTVLGIGGRNKRNK